METSLTQTLICNFLGGPGSGKSTLSYGVIAFLKSHEVKAEYIPEYAKELTYRRNWEKLADQASVLREQDRRIRDLIGHVSAIIQDTALPLGLVYASGEYAQDWFTRRTWELFDGYQNFNVFVVRKKKYQLYGRSQSEHDARQLDDRIRRLFEGRIDLEVPGEEGSVETVCNALMDRIGRV